MKFKEEKLQARLLKDEFFKLDPMLQMILCAMNLYTETFIGKEITLTSLIRKDNKKSPHYYGRGADIRSFDFTKKEIEHLLSYINEKFIYDENRPNLKTLICHDARQGIHLHAQVMDYHRMNNARAK